MSREFLRTHDACDALMTSLERRAARLAEHLINMRAEVRRRVDQPTAEPWLRRLEDHLTRTIGEVWDLAGLGEDIAQALMEGE